MAREYVLKTFRPPVDLKIDYARELNAQQLAAVTAPPGPSLVIAGAGSGKTRTLTYRVAYLLEQGIPADRILLLTFTNKAAREMMRRVSDLVGEELSQLWGGTFHSIGARLLRRHAEVLGYRQGFTILDRDDAEALIKTCIGESEIDLKATRFPKAETLADIFSMAANLRISIAEQLKREGEWPETLNQQVQQLAERYQARKRADNVMDFDDLLTLWLRLLEEHQDLRERYQNRFQFVLVDEYQDTNKLQGDLIDLLVQPHHNVMVVGDDSQSIYGWRGANFRNIIDFPKRHPQTSVYKIEVNYRSTPEILAVANAAIEANVEQFAKVLQPERKSGSKPIVVACADGNQQAMFIAQRVLELRDEGVSMENMAVLYRSHFHTMELQMELTRHNIPFSITSGIRFFEQAHLKDAISYLKLLSNPQDELSFKRIAQMLPGVGTKAAQKLWLAYSEQLPRFQQLAPPPATPAGEAPDEDAFTLDVITEIEKALVACQTAVPKKAVTLWAQLAITFSQLRKEQLPAKMLELIIEAGYEDYLKETYANHRSRIDDLKQLAIFAQQFADLPEFLTQLSLLTNVEAEGQTPDTVRDEERLRLSTIHQAKGLEFDVVFVIMLCEGLFPSARSLETRDGEEEERRLFYVSITRARNELYLCHPHMRLAHSYTGDISLQPARFFNEIPPSLVEELKLVPEGF